jgi:flagellar biosynthesis chaperone FliJ
MQLKTEASTRVGTLQGDADKAKRLQFKYEQAKNEKETLTRDLGLAAEEVMDANENLKNLEGARDILNKKLQEASKALDVAKDGTPLEFVIKIDKNPNYKASKLQELTEFVRFIYERYSEKDLFENKDDENFPFPLKKVTNGGDVLDQLEYKYKIIVEIKSDPILFCTFNDLIWNMIFNDESLKTCDYFFSFIEWIATDVFKTINLASCKIRKRKRDKISPPLEADRIAKKAASAVATTASPGSTASTTTNTTTTSTTSTSNSDNVVVLRDLQKWSLLSSEEKTQARNLEYSQFSWDNFNYISSFSTKLGDLNPKKKSAVDFLFQGAWPPGYARGESLEERRKFGGN